jgi:hypothetical protein
VFVEETKKCQWFLVNDLRDAQIPFYVLIFIYVYNSQHVLSTSCSSSGETNCVNTTAGNRHSVLVAVSCAGWEWVHSQPAHDTATNTEWQLPEVVLTQFVSPDDEHDVLETCRELKIIINTCKGICASRWSFTKNNYKMNSQENIKYKILHQF